MPVIREIVALGIWKISHGVRRHPEVRLGRSADHRCAASNRTAVVHSPDWKRRAIFEVDLDRLARVNQRWQPHSRLAKRGIDDIPRIANKYISTISTVMQPPILEAIVCAGRLVAGQRSDQLDIRDLSGSRPGEPRYIEYMHVTIDRIH
jgi:hypothetical protein